MRRSAQFEVDDLPPRVMNWHQRHESRLRHFAYHRKLPSCAPQQLKCALGFSRRGRSQVPTRTPDPRFTPCWNGVDTGLPRRARGHSASSSA